MVTLERGKPYPMPLATKEGAGASAQFLTQSGNILQVVLPDMTATEERALRNGLCKAGFLAEEGDILLVFEFYGDNGTPSITVDCPFDARLIHSDNLALPDISKPESERILFEVHAIDEKPVLRGLRGLTFSPSLTLDFLQAVQTQLATPKGLLPTFSKLRWEEMEPQDLIATKSIKMEGCGR